MRFYFNSLGCDKTLCDSEHIISALVNAGAKITDDINEADVIALNTCCFIGDALQESIDTVIEYGKYNKKLIVFGCMAKRFKEDIPKELPEIDLLIPETEPDAIIDSLLKELDLKNPGKYGRFLTGAGYSTYLKIAEGCNKHCTYCVIPSLRGNYKSIPMEELIEEASMLATTGVKELILVAQETTLYGIDLYQAKSLHILIRKLSKIPGIEWIRILYAYPEEVYPELIDEMAENEKVCHYIDIPLQHGCDKILKAMGRRARKEGIINLVSTLRQRIPDIVIRTTFICGFPGEDDADFKELCDFVKEMSFERVGVFAYSREDKTAAFDMENQVPDDIKEERRDILMGIAQDKSYENNRLLIGQVLRCIVEGRLVEENVYQARSYMDIPDVDGLVFFESDKDFMSGDFVDIKITDAYEYDLKGEEYEYSK